MQKRSRHAHKSMVTMDNWNTEDTRKITKGDALRSVGEVVYAFRIGELVKIGHTTNLMQRHYALRASEVLAFAPGTPADEQNIHARLTAHLDHGREWYRPTSAVLDVVNELRSRIGLSDLDSLSA